MLSFKQYLDEAKKVSDEESDTVKTVKGKKKVDQGTRADMNTAKSSEKKLELMNGKVNKVDMEPKLNSDINLTGKPR